MGGSAVGGRVIGLNGLVLKCRTGWVDGGLRGGMRAGALWLDCAVPRAPKDLGARGTAQSFGGSGAKPLSKGREWVGAAGARNAKPAAATPLPVVAA
ncbi:hypothetical protein GCM10018775_83560 [Streptomyces umbrinus]|nr:hypothetical protein GCM10018775_83560 [Streptomyces umbrinus]